VTSVEIGSVPDRKSKAISVVDGSASYVVAYFRDDESYERFKAACQGSARLTWQDEDQ
jgi:membrane-bound lytic murein transglycosylase